MEEIKDTTKERMGRGFKVLKDKLKNGYNKLCNSQFVKDVQAENEDTTSDPYEFVPAQFISTEEEVKKKREKKDDKKIKDQFSTDFTDLGCAI